MPRARSTGRGRWSARQRLEADEAALEHGGFGSHGASSQSILGIAPSVRPPRYRVAMNRFAGPGWRIAGAIVVLGAVRLLLHAALPVDVGPRRTRRLLCERRPYVIETQCPETVICSPRSASSGCSSPLAIGLLFQRGFAAPVVVWAWPILFVGLGIQFLPSSPSSRAPYRRRALRHLVRRHGGRAADLRAAGWARDASCSARPTCSGQRFRDRDGAPRTFYAFGREDPAATGRRRLPCDWLFSLVVWIGSIAWASGSAC